MSGVTSVVRMLLSCDVSCSDTRQALSFYVFKKMLWINDIKTETEIYLAFYFVIARNFIQKNVCYLSSQSYQRSEVMRSRSEAWWGHGSLALHLHMNREYCQLWLIRGSAVIPLTLKQTHSYLPFLFRASKDLPSSFSDSGFFSSLSSLTSFVYRLKVLPHLVYTGTMLIFLSDTLQIHMIICDFTFSSKYVRRLCLFSHCENLKYFHDVTFMLFYMTRI